jgi:hypothetical protein
MMNYNRRTLLKAAGTTMALPYLASLHGAEAAEPTRRMVFLSFGWGVTKETWFPDSRDTGASYALPEGLKPLARHKSDFSLVLNTSHQHTRDGHWGSTFFLTGANRYAIPGKNFNNSVSVDQIAAQAWGDDNRFASLQLDCRKANNSGHGPGLSLSWNHSGKPMAGLQTPFIVYNRLFGNESMSIDERRELISRRGSSLDAVLLNAKSVRRKLSHDDSEKLDEYMESVRDIEVQLAKEESWLGKPKPKAPLDAPQKGLQGYEEIKLMYDLIVAALQTNSTRVVTYRQPVDTLLKSLDVTITGHNMSHYAQGSRFEVSKLRDEKQSELLAYFFDKLKKTPDSDGQSLFDSTTVSYGSNIKTSHTLNNCPLLVAGNTSKLKLGQHLHMPQDTPLCNVWRSLLHANGLHHPSFGDSTDLVEDLLV